MKKVDPKIETIFAHAVALESTGRLKNTIYVEGSDVFILNSDHTVLLQFRLPSSSAPFKEPLSFKADDYDSSMFFEEGGKIVFVQQSGDMIRKKYCGKPLLTVEEIGEMFLNFPPIDENACSIHKDIMPLLDDSLSHIEISGEAGELVIKQRNIFDGTIIEIERKPGEGFGVSNRDHIETNFGPIGIRTGDFLALFSFNDEVTFYFPGSEADYARVWGRNFSMSGIVALCMYDELGEITNHKENDDGREVKKVRRSKQTVNRSTDKGQRRKGRR